MLPNIYVAVWIFIFIFFNALASDLVEINCRIYLCRTPFPALVKRFKSVPYKFPIHLECCLSGVSACINSRNLGPPLGVGTELQSSFRIRNSYVSCLHLTSNEIHYLLFQISSSPTLVINIISFLPSMV